MSFHHFMSKFVGITNVHTIVFLIVVN